MPADATVVFDIPGVVALPATNQADLDPSIFVANSSRGSGATWIDFPVADNCVFGLLATHDMDWNAQEENYWLPYIVADDEAPDTNRGLGWSNYFGLNTYSHSCGPFLTGGHVVRRSKPKRLYDIIGIEQNAGEVVLIQCKIAPALVRERVEHHEVSMAPGDVAPVNLPSGEASELVASVENILEGRPTEDLARLVGVSRATWISWRQGDQAIRSGSRRRLIRLLRILQIRRSVVPQQSLNLWLDTPLGRDLDTTPASLLQEGRDQPVAMLAVQTTTATDDTLVLHRPMDLGTAADPAISEERIRNRARYGADDVEE